MSMRIEKLLIGAALAVSLAACGQSKGAPAASADAASADASAPAAAPGGAVDNAKLADGRPAFAADYPGATNSSYVPGAEMDGNKAGMLQFESTDSADAIISYYRAKSDAAGFKSNGEGGNLGEMSVYNATGASNAEFGLIVSGKGPSHKVMVTWIAPA